MIKRIGTAAALAAVTGTMASADSFSLPVEYLDVELSFANTDGEETGEATFSNLQIASEFTSNNIFGSVGLLYSQQEFSGREFSYWAFEGLVGYNINPNIGVYGVVQSEGGDRRDTENYVGFGAVYRLNMGEVGIEAFDYDDETAITIYGGYEVSPELDFFGSLTKFEDDDGLTYGIGGSYDTEQSETDFFILGYSDYDEYLVSLSTDYFFTDDIKGIASIGADIFEGQTIGNWRLGGGYQIKDGMWVEATYGEPFASGDRVFVQDASFFGIKLTFEYGGDASARTKAIEASQTIFQDVFVGGKF